MALVLYLAQQFCIIFMHFVPSINTIKFFFVCMYVGVINGSDGDDSEDKFD